MTTSGNKLIETDPSYFVILAMWWGWMWRMMLWMLLLMVVLFVVIFTASFVVGAAGVLGTDPQKLGMMGGVFSLLGFVMGMAVQMKALKQIIGKKFGGHRLVFLTPQAVAESDRAADAALGGISGGGVSGGSAGGFTGTLGSVTPASANPASTNPNDPPKQA